MCAIDVFSLYLITLLAIMNVEIGAKFFDSPTYGFFMFSDKKLKTLIENYVENFP